MDFVGEILLRLKNRIAYVLVIVCIYRIELTIVLRKGGLNAKVIQLYLGTGRHISANLNKTLKLCIGYMMTQSVDDLNFLVVFLNMFVQHWGLLTLKKSSIN